jgi:hypothetical protein
MVKTSVWRGAGGDASTVTLGGGVGVTVIVDGGGGAAAGASAEEIGGSPDAGNGARVGVVIPLGDATSWCWCVWTIAQPAKPIARSADGTGSDLIRLRRAMPLA